MQIKVVKFGGSSLADAAHFKQVASIIRSDPARRYVIPSAPGKRFSDDVKVTDMLYRCYEMAKAHEDISEYFDKIGQRYSQIIADLGLDFDISGELDYVKNAILHNSGRDYAASRGEYLNGLILAKYLGFPFVDAENVIFFKDNGALDEKKTDEALKNELKGVDNAVIPGFYGSMPNGTIKTFSRGGSDITGSIVSRAVDATLYENWTDVSGVKMADPRIIKDPLTIEVITYQELRELSYMGATVLHEDAIFPVRHAGIPINIKNTNAPEAPGTFIVAKASGYDAQHIITGVAGKKGFSVITVEKAMMNSELGFGRRFLAALEAFDISFEHLPSSIDTMSVVIASSALKPVQEKLLAEIGRMVNPDSIEVTDEMALVAVVGRGMVKAKGVACRVFDAVSSADVNIRMIDQGSSELNIILGVEERDFEKTLQAIYSEFVKE